ncbi:hypothetical protein SLEP1_g49371 [Rubroshorea leprosula]|uniref:Uncharacterized protein n=1 Tax=Rubroshorea leprosula TaxID=152421 RepID=A0AAV5LWL7_9ROSI|nr:hypothetical protein SLEP1_g49371 [Rubroshorea leprosula]
MARPQAEMVVTPGRELESRESLQKQLVGRDKAVNSSPDKDVNKVDYAQHQGKADLVWLRGEIQAKCRTVTS